MDPRLIEDGVDPDDPEVIGTILRTIVDELPAQVATSDPVRRMYDSGMCFVRVLILISVDQLVKIGIPVGHAMMLMQSIRPGSVRAPSVPIAPSEIPPPPPRHPNTTQPAPWPVAGINSPPSTGYTGQTSPPGPNDGIQKTPIETALTKKRQASQAFPTEEALPTEEAPEAAPDQEAPAQSLAEAPAQSPAEAPIPIPNPQSGRAPSQCSGARSQCSGARSQCSGVSEARGNVPKTGRKVSTCQHTVCSPHNALDLELDKQAHTAARSQSKLNVTLAVHFSN